MLVAATIVLVALIPSIAPAYCPGGKMEKSDIDDKVLSPINEVRINIIKGGIIQKLPTGTKMNKIEWDCELEKEVNKLLDVADCPPVPDTIPADTTPFYWEEYDANVPLKDVIRAWLKDDPALDSLMQSTSFVYDSTKTTIPYLDEFCNLIRASTTGIACVEAFCDDGVFNNIVYCLTNRSKLEDGDSIYDKGSGACTPTAGCDRGRVCNTNTGLCEATAMSTTTVDVTTTFATTTPASYRGELPSGTNTQCSSNVGMTDELRMQFLDTQNYRRSILAKGQIQRPSGNYLPTGANIIKLNFSCALEKEAIQEVRQCPTSKTTNGTYGKNFDTFASSTITSTYRDAVKKAVTNWWKVVRKESNGPGVNQVTFRSNHVNQPVETYTQIAWANTRSIGCAIAKCDYSYTVICLYDPKGNIVDQVLYMKGSPCAACPNGTTCDSALGLCAQQS